MYHHIHRSGASRVWLLFSFEGLIIGAFYNVMIRGYWLLCVRRMVVSGVFVRGPQKMVQTLQARRNLALLRRVVEGCVFGRKILKYPATLYFICFGALLLLSN